MTTTVPTRCRICESACGLLAEHEAGTIVSLRPDPLHPLSKGYACRKGMDFLQIVNHPRRLVQPMVRGDVAGRDRGGELRATSWKEALSGAGTRLALLRAEHGPSAVGLYIGNAAAHSLGTVLGTAALQKALGTPKNYSSLTLDNSEMFVVLEECLGNPMLTFLADYAGSDLVVLFGTDPLASQPSQVQSQPGGVAEIVAKAREGALIVVDPRRSETARRTERHVRPRPGSDATLLAALLRVVLADPARRRRAEEDTLLVPADLARLADAVAPFTLARAAAATGLSTESLRELAGALLAAERPLVWSGLGILLGPDGTVGYWLTLALQAALGGLDRPGGWLQQRGAVDLPKLFRRLGVPGRDRTLTSRIGGYPAVLGTVAAATLAEDVLTEGPDRLRGLVVVGGNPAIALPDTPRAQQALRALDLLVCVDLFVNDTGVLADVVLPASTFLERDDLDLQAANQRRRPHLQLDRAVVPPREEARSDWEILVALARAAGRPAFGSHLADTALRWTGADANTIGRLAVSFASPLRWREVAEATRGVEGDGAALGTLRRRGTDRLDGTLLLAVPEFLEALRGRLGMGTEPDAGPGTTPSLELCAEAPAALPFLHLQLITSVRPVETMNSWMHDLPGAARRTPVARLHPDDLGALGLTEGAAVRLSRPAAPECAVIVLTRAEPEQRPGIVVLPYGWGHLPGAIGAGQGPASVNANVLVDTERLERFTGQPLSNGLWVRAEAGSA